MSIAKIMVVEDESIIALELSETLQSLGYDVPVVAGSGETAVTGAKDEKLDLAIIDINLGRGMDGIEAGQEITRSRNIPIIYLTAYSDEDTLKRAKQVRPFGYLVKPFDIETLNATIQMALERAKHNPVLDSMIDDFSSRQRLQVADLVLDIVDRKAIRAKKPIELTNREFDLLRFLMEHVGDVVARDEIRDRVWHNYRFTSSNVVDVYIRYLRQKIDHGHKVHLIKTIRNRGYILSEEERV